MNRFVHFVFLILVCCVSSANWAQADPVKDHFIQLFEKGSLPKPLEGMTYLTCANVTDPSQGFRGYFQPQGDSIVITDDDRHPRELVTPVDNALRGQFTLIRESASGELILMSIKSFLGMTFDVDPNDIVDWKVDVLVCTI